MTPAEIKQFLSCIDLTSLNDNDSLDSITALCTQAIKHAVAAVCIYPQFVSHAWQQLINTSIKIATVANFPHGTSPFTDVAQTIQQALLDGADEIDIVIPYHLYKTHNQQDVREFIQQCKFYCNKKLVLKIILETGALSPGNIQQACEDAIAGGADFIKTSSGKISIGATEEAARIILSTIKSSAQKIGFKVSGGIRSVEQAQLYANLAKDYLGEAAINPIQFRIGASSLVDKLVEKLHE